MWDHITAICWLPWWREWARKASRPAAELEGIRKTQPTSHAKWITGTGKGRKENCQPLIKCSCIFRRGSKKMEAISSYFLGFRNLASNIPLHPVAINHNGLCKKKITCNRNLICVQWETTIPHSILLFFVPALANNICRNMLKWVST